MVVASVLNNSMDKKTPTESGMEEIRRVDNIVWYKCVFCRCIVVVDYSVPDVMKHKGRQCPGCVHEEKYDYPFKYILEEDIETNSALREMLDWQSLIGDN